MSQNVIVRFAPSPTGYLHVGGARTAIFNWLFARKHGGKFILRIEDTDTQRSSKESVQGILDGLKWLGLNWDEGPNFQKDNLAEHIFAAQKLLETGHAYKCFCTAEELAQKRSKAQERKETYRYDGTCRTLPLEACIQKEERSLPYTIRFKVPQTEGSVAFTDAVYGPIEKKYRDIEDFVIVRSNGMPLYILTNAIDDILDKVTHVIRGQDGLANTPKQILIYKALHAPLPTFAHMSLALDSKKAKISKRKHGEQVAVHFYREKGFIPWALVNFLVLLGWSAPDNREYFSKEELIQAFSLEGLSRHNPVFNMQDPPSAKHFTDPKAVNINAHYLRQMALTDLLPSVIDALKQNGIDPKIDHPDQREKFERAIDLLREKYHYLTDFSTLGRAFFANDFQMDPAAWEKHLIKPPQIMEILLQLGNQIEALKEFSAETIETVLRENANTHGIKIGQLINGVRTALTGQQVGPGIIEVLLMIGQECVVQRLKAVSGHTGPS